MTGLALSRALYRQAAPRLEAAFPEAVGRIAVGLAGPGSECFGFDDEVSRDHDFAPRLCLWIPEEDEGSLGGPLRAFYRDLTRDLPAVTSQAEDRSGVITIPEFYRRFTGCPGVPQTALQWLRVPDHLLATAVNGEVFRDDLGEFTALREALLEGYPPDVRRKKLAARLFAMGQAGQYNLPRCLRRGDGTAAFLASAEFVSAALQAVFLLNRRYAPYYKWLHRAALDLPLCRESVRLLGELPRSEDPAALAEQISGEVLEELLRQGLTASGDDFLVNQAFSVAEGIEDPQLAALDISVG